MFKNELISLVRSLSGHEKRSFKLLTKKQAGAKIYMDLYDMIEETRLDKDVRDIQLLFQKKYPRKSFENTANYLLRLITDSLINNRKEHDKWFQQWHTIMRSRILHERSIVHAGYRELKKAQKLSFELQDNLAYYHTCKLDLNYWSDMGFPGQTENDIVQKHMKAKSSLRLLNKVQEQSSLFDILKYRTLRSGKSLSNKDNEKLNDLLLTELSLITRDFQENFESKKLHLLFQSFFFIHASDFKSSLKSFNELNELFESNESVWSHPPYDYLSTLDGILDNLRTIRRYDVMEPYIQKVEELSKRNYPENFQNVTLQTAYIYRLAVYVNTKDIIKARTVLEEIPLYLLKNTIPNSFEKLAELLFNVGLVEYADQKLKKAIKHFNFIMSINKVNHHLAIYKAARLMHILIHYESKNQSYLDYEIRSYKRSNANKDKLLKIENLVLSVVKFNPRDKLRMKNKLFWEKVSKKKDEIEQNKFENQLLKYFNFLDWIKLTLVGS